MLALLSLPFTIVQEGWNHPKGGGSIEQKQNYKLNALKERNSYVKV